jgi:crotonobetainyl-CoA:carnitine CoA-transferase CaiB-like acyl-CoA transferase
LARDPRFLDFALRNENREELISILSDVFRARSTEVWLERLGAARVPAGAVNDVAGALRDPQVAARGAIVEYEHPTLGTIRQVASPFRLDGHQPMASRAPLRGEHTSEVLARVCGYSSEQIRNLANEGVFGGTGLGGSGPVLAGMENG